MKLKRFTSTPVKPRIQPTLADVARKAGVSLGTTSMALRGLARVAPATRARVAAVAARMGYQINSAASMLARQRIKGVPQRLLIGFLADAPWEVDRFFLPACEARGWEGRVFMADKFPSPEAASRSLWQQGVDGLILSLRSTQSSFWKNYAQFDWNRFPVVKLSRGMPELAFNLVRLSTFDYMLKALETITGRGYRRVAVLMYPSASERDDLAMRGAFLAYKMKLGDNCGIALEWWDYRENLHRTRPLEASFPLEASCLKWLRKFQPDAILGFHWAFIYPLLVSGIKIPDETALAAVLSTNERHRGIPRISGCNYDTITLYERALGVLETQYLKGVRGFVTHPMEHVIEPVWIEGGTLPRKERSRGRR